MDYIHTYAAVSLQASCYVRLSLVHDFSLISSTPRADAIFLFISDILWLSKLSKSLPLLSEH